MSEDNATSYQDLNFDGLERRGNYRFIAFREDILHALDKSEAAAIIFQIVFRWQTEYKRDEVLKLIERRKKSGHKPYTPEEIEDLMFVYMSYNDFVRESGGALGYNTVIRTIKYLVDDVKVFKQRKNHDQKFADYEYSIDKKVTSELLKSLPVDPAFAPKIPKKKVGSTQMGTVTSGSTQMGTQAQGSTQMGTGSTQMGTEVYPNGCTSQEHTRTTQEQGTYGDENVASQPILSLSSEEKVTHNVDKLSTKPIATTKSVRKEKIVSPKKAEPMLSDKARAVWEVWLQMPWNKDMAPDLTETAAKHCEKLSTVEITIDIMFKIRNFANKNDNNGFYKGKAWTLGNVVSEYSKWKSSEYTVIGSTQASQTKEKEVVTVGNMYLQKFSSRPRY